MSLRLSNISFDCHDAGVVAEFWAAALGRPLPEGRDPSFMALPAGAPGEPSMMFFQVPEGKVAKNRVHLDLGAEDQRAEVERLLALGATEVAAHEEAGYSWTVVADPEGNEFCVVQKA